MANLLSTVVNGYLASKLFIPGFDGSGWKIWEWVKGRYKLEVDDLTVRGTMTIFELVISKIRALLGAMAITLANGKVKGIREDVSYYYLEIEDDMSFVEHDIVRCQTFNKNNVHGYWVEVSEILGNEIKVSKDEFARNEKGEVADPPREGDELVQFGNSSKDAKYAGRHSAIYLSADETGQPCIDVLQGIYSKSFEGCMKLRAGCLDGINDADFPEGVKGFGIYCANGYFKGDIAGAGGYMLRSDGSGYIAGGAISWRWNAVQKKYVVTMGSDVVLQWENLSEETRRNLKGKDGRDGINGRNGAKGDPGRDADIVFPWLEDWQANGTDIGGEHVVSPKMFSGTRDVDTGKLTGVAFGKDCITVGGETRTGVFALVDDEVVFELDPVNKRYSFKGRIEADEGYFEGEIKAEKGNIGWFKLINGNLIGYNKDGMQRVALTQNSVPELDDLYEGPIKYLPDNDFAVVETVLVNSGDTPDAKDMEFDYNYDIIDSSNEFYNMRFWMEDSYDSVYSNPGSVEFKVKFTLAHPGSVKFDIENTISNPKAIINNYISMYSDASLTNCIASIDSNSEAVLEEGTYYLLIRLGYYYNNLPPTGTTNLEVGMNIKNVMFRHIRKCNIIGNNGLISRWGAQKYMFFSEKAGFEVRYKNNGFKIDDQGVYKMKNGNWSSL